MNFYHNSLTDLSHTLKSNQIDMLGFVHEICDRLDDTEPTIKAFVPEKDRRERLVKEAQLLLEKFPTPTERPPFFGIPVGIKDLFHVDGLETRGGSKLPPEALRGDQASMRPSIHRM